jgi:hypothetical protein
MKRPRARAGKIIRPAKSYTQVDDLCVISSFFNPNRYKTKTRNCRSFISSLERSNLNYVMVECSFGAQKYALKESPRVLRVRTTDVMWQKERLLNIALQHVPKTCSKVAWIDCDVLFVNKDWAKETCELLNNYKIIQPFEFAIRLAKGATSFSGDGEPYRSFASVLKNNPVVLGRGTFALHGHTGFAWASHKDLLQRYGLYDAGIAGTGDHTMAHAFAGDWDGKCIARIIGQNPRFYRHYVNWSRRIYQSVRAQIGYVEGTLLHLWHGDVKNRRYVERDTYLEKYRYDPYKDIALDKNGCWKWNNGQHELKKWAREYFTLRQED